MKAKAQTKKVKFEAVDSGEVEIKKLNLAAVRKLQDIARDHEDTESFESNIEAIRTVVRMSVVGAADMSDEDFDEFALGDLAELQQEIMAYSGLSAVETDDAGND